MQHQGQTLHLIHPYDKKKSLSVPAVSRVAGRPPRQKGPRGLERATAGIFVFKVVNNGTSSSVSGFGWDGSQ